MDPSDQWTRVTKPLRLQSSQYSFGKSIQYPNIALISRVAQRGKKKVRLKQNESAAVAK